MNITTNNLYQQFLAGAMVSFALLLLMPCYGNAQYRNMRNVEIAINASVSNALAIPVERDGIVVVQRDKDKDDEGNRVAHLSLYNTELSQEWEMDVPVGKKLEISQYKYTDGKLYLVFSDLSEENLQIIRVDPKAKEYITMPFYAFRGISYYDMEVIDDRVYLVGAYLRQSLLFMLDLNTRGNRLLNTQLGREESIIKNLTAREENNLIHVVLNNPSLGDKSVTIRSFDEKGMIKDDLIVNVDKKFQLLEAELVEVGDGNTAVVGTYAPKKSTIAEGVFVKAKDQEEVSYYAFQNMPEFAPIAQNDTQKKKRKKEGDFIAINKVVALHGQFMMVTEAYDLVYDKANTLVGQYNDPERSFKNVWAHNDLSYHRINMTDFTRRLTAVAGYQLKYASMITFDANGNLLWGKNLGLRDEDVSKAYKRLKVITKPEQITFLNNYSGEVYRMGVDDQQMSTLKQSQKLDKDGNPVQAEEVTVTGGELLGAAHWYDNYYLNIAVQQVEDGSSSRKKGTVLLLKKVKG